MKFKFVEACGLAAGLAVGLAAAPAGAVTTVGITGAGLYAIGGDVTFDGTVSGNAPGPYTRATGPIAVNLNGSPILTWVYCLDWNHYIPAHNGAQLIYATPLAYTIGGVTTDSTGTLSGTGNPLTLLQSEEIATLLQQGIPVASQFSYAPLAYQAAIWDIEYNLTQPSSTPSVELNLINADIAYAEAHPETYRAVAFYSVDGSTQALGTVPEPATWSLMLIGFGGLGAAMRSRRKALAA